MLLIGKFKPREVAYEQVYTKQVDITPWKYLKVTGMAVCVIVIGIYVYFAQ
jgi:SSS family solute:Na+ symporter